MKARPSLRPLLSAPQVSLGLIRQSGPCDDWLSFNHLRHSLWHSERRCQVPAVLCNVSGVHQGVWTKGWVPRVWDKPRCGFNDGPFIVNGVPRTVQWFCWGFSASRDTVQCSTTSIEGVLSFVWSLRVAFCLLLLQLRFPGEKWCLCLRVLLQLIQGQLGPPSARPAEM